MNREHVLEQLQPIVEQLADKILELADKTANDILRERLQSLISPPNIPDEPKRRTARVAKGKPAAVTKPRKSVTENIPTEKRKPNSCNKCGAIGFTSRTCGKTHNVQEEQTDEEVDSKPPPSTAKPIASPRSKPQLPHVAAADDVPLHKVVAFSF